MARLILSIERLRELVSYDPTTGIITGLYKCSRRDIGDPVGSANSLGYVEMRIKGMRVHRHVAGWALVNNRWPTEDIDHIDHTPGHDWILNLREIPHRHNQQNRRGPAINNKSGFLGVRLHQAKPHHTPRWSGSLKGADGKQIYLGMHA